MSLVIYSKILEKKILGHLFVNESQLTLDSVI